MSLDIFYRNYMVSIETMLETPLFLAHGTVWQETAKALAQLGISPEEGRVLEALGQAEHTTMGMIAAKSGLLLPALSKLADRLEARGLARRVGAEDDTRRVYLRLTSAGEKLRTEALAAIAQVDRLFAERVGSWEIDRLLRLLAKFNGEKAP
jgi:DNA-binding MarR family transcriptional regulator